jgi:rSAM/selenodomain-associated transferase 2
MQSPCLSVIVPVLNEAATVGPFVAHHIDMPGLHELIVVDGGSTDGTVDHLRGFGSRIKVMNTSERRGRAAQMNAGASAASGDVLMFLHVDCTLHKESFVQVRQAFIKDPSLIGGGFLKKYSNENFFLTWYRMAMNGIRSRLLRNLVGTNAMFIRKDIFQKIGGFDEVPILEDVILCDRMKKIGRLAVLTPHVRSSSRRYSGQGRFRRMWIAFRILFLYRVMKTPLHELKRMYTP